MESYLKNNNLECCSGCGACVQACPTHSITFTKQEDGFNVPEINEEKCIHCNKCMNVCPYSHPVDYYKTIKSYAVKTKNADAQIMSSSGGCFFGLACSVIERGGIVFGAIMDKSYCCVHQVATNYDELKPLLGSKYVQSRCDIVFPMVKASLCESKIVLFAGTPCQIAGLKNFLVKEYENLLLVDIACHGVPSNSDFLKCIEWIEQKHGGKLTYLRFRDKKYAGWIHSLTYKVEKNNSVKIRTVAPYKIPYYYFFLYSRNIRRSCYKCPYVGTLRVGDITLADFWAAERLLSEKEIGKGISVALCNTKKGVKWLNKSTEYLDIRQIDTDLAVRNNQPFSQLPNTYPMREELLNHVISNGYKDIRKYYRFRELILGAVKAAVPETVKRKIFRLFGEKR